MATAGLWVFTALLWSTTRRAVADGEKAITAAVAAAAAANQQAGAATRAADAMAESALHAQTIAQETAKGLRVMEGTAERQLRAYIAASVEQHPDIESLTENAIAMNGSAGVESLIRAFRG